MAKESSDPSIAPDDLLFSMAYSPADNIEGYDTHLPWKSRMAGGWIRSTLQWKNILGTMADSPLLFGPLSITARFQKSVIETWFTDTIHRHARICTRKGITPDIFVEQDENTEEAYGDLLYELCGRFMKNGSFDREKAAAISGSEKGRQMLKQTVREFAWLERQYNCMGLTRLKAMKDLMKTLLITITEQPLKNSPMPFAARPKPGSPSQSFADYLAVARTRLENLYNERAFNIRTFSEVSTGGKIGYSPFEIVEGSGMHSVALRHYPLPDKITPNNKVLYMVSPLINKPEIFDLGKGKSVIRGMQEQGYTVYLQDPGNPGPDQTDLGLDFYGKRVHDRYLDIIRQRHPDREIHAMGYCMGGTLFLPYIARRAQERLSQGKAMDVQRVALMATPVKFDDRNSGHGPMRGVIRQDYDETLMEQMYGSVNVPPQIVSVGMNEIQPGVQYTVAAGFYSRASYPGAISDSAPFLYWLTHGTKFGAKAHRQWIRHIFMENRIFNQRYVLPSSVPEFDGKPVDMDILKQARVRIFDYRGERDPISPVGSCVASEIWGLTEEDNRNTTRGGLNRTIEKNVGHIFVVSRKLLAEYLEKVNAFFSS